MPPRTDNTDRVPAEYELVYRDDMSSDRVYRCKQCGWKTPWVRNGEQFRDEVRQRHLCFPPRVGQ